MGFRIPKKEIREIFKTSRIFNGFCGPEGTPIELFIPLLTFLDEVDNPSELQKPMTNINLSRAEDKIQGTTKAKKRGRHL